ncbi:hypothetical protein CONPUDRAFT_168135 [Coniophora puteana RWD-64-598 SS2]|uniref:Wings apart-like protein C-terminal domain-containing protein n=1 Tax=Coniophora puteana (strain RWD-64-598) TaxID=741705 RepID=A0A5M3ME06_CONPW|nr:uncharacterized protein CONPUDRAFT_168135 [Coniophora puteana RWD-64-598 SS2]EIW77120.1 hypothetical protein CONPUDRAFT_168135 [Coniophora puteana RWD-64-598 SS2]
MQRTYGRKRSIREVRQKASSPSISSDVDHGSKRVVARGSDTEPEDALVGPERSGGTDTGTLPRHTRKRRKPNVEIVSPSRPNVPQHPSPSTRSGLRSSRQSPSPPPSASHPIQRDLSTLSLTETGPAKSFRDPHPPTSNSLAKETSARRQPSRPSSSTSPSKPAVTSTPVEKPASRSRGGVVRRMLARTQTEPANISQAASKEPKTPPRSRTMGETASVTASPSRPSPGKNPSTSALDIAPSGPSPSKPSTSGMRTYGGARSFLLAIPAEDALGRGSVGGGIGGGAEDLEVGASYTELRARWGVDEPDEPFVASTSTFKGSSTVPGSPSKKLARSTSGSGSGFGLGPASISATDLAQSAAADSGLWNDLKSITELRSKGERRRFSDEVGYLFEGLGPEAAPGLRRSSALELVRKLCDPQFARVARASEFATRALSAFITAREAEADTVLDATIAAFLSLAAHDVLVRAEPAVLKCFIGLAVGILSGLTPEHDVLARAHTGRSNGKSSIAASARAMGLSKTQYTALRALVAAISDQPTHFAPASQVSTRLFISSALAALPRSTLANEAALIAPVVLDSLRCELALVDVRLDAYEHGGSLYAPEKDDASAIRAPSVEHADNCMYILGALVMGADCTVIGVSDRDAFAKELSAIIAFAAIVLRDHETEVEERYPVTRCLSAALRLMTILSLRDDGWCGVFSEDATLVGLVVRVALLVQQQWTAVASEELGSKSGSEATQETEGRVEVDEPPLESESTELFDLLCLALGACMRWVTASGSASRALYRHTRSSTDCTGTRTCVRRCSCRSPPTLLEGLAHLHAQTRSPSPSPSDADEDSPRALEQHFFRGYVAVLLGVLVQQDSTSERLVLAVLRGAMRGPPAAALVDDCRVFVELYQQVNAQLVKPSASSGEGSPAAGGEGGGEELAREAIRTWERFSARRAPPRNLHRKHTRSHSKPLLPSPFSPVPPTMRAVSAEATKLVRSILAESPVALSTDEIFKQVLLHRRAMPENESLRAPSTNAETAAAGPRPGSVEEFRQARAQKRADAKDFEKGPVRTKKELQMIVLPTLTSRGLLTKIGAGVLPASELAARFPLTPGLTTAGADPSPPSHPQKHNKHTPTPTPPASLYLWKLRTPPLTATTRSVNSALELGLRPVTPADVGADADWTHLSRRRRRAREAAVRRDVEETRELQEERMRAAAEALAARRERVGAPQLEV